MKKFKYLLFALPLLLLGACSADMGTEAGTDTEPVVTLFSYTPGKASGLNPDNDVQVRFATNSVTKEVYYLTELKEDVNAFIAANGEEAYMQKVIAQGEKFEVNGAENVDKDLTGIFGDCLITAVAVNGGSHTKATLSFLGLSWETLTTGTFSPRVNGLPSGFASAIQVCESDENLYRIKDALGEGNHIKFTLMDEAYAGQDSDGPYRLVRVAEQSTPFAAAGYPVLIADYATFKKDASLAADENNASFMWTNDYFCAFLLAWYLPDGRYVSIDYSFFIPD